MTEIIYKNTFLKDFYTKEENKQYFIIRLRIDILKAVELWDKKHKTAYRIHKADDFVKNFDKVRDTAIKDAEDRYKTQSQRDEYINEVLSNYILKNANEMIDCKWYDEITFFDIDLNPGSIGISGNCILKIDKLTDEVLEACWNEIKNNKYFKEADGWQFENGCGRPQIKLHLPKKLQKQFDAEKESLQRSIEKFYGDSTHYGY